jgi:uncharacterized membrane protein YqjE
VTAPPPPPQHAAQPGATRLTTQPTAADGTPRHAADQTLGELVRDVCTSASTLVQREIELAKLELRSSVKNAGVGAGMFVAAAVLLVFSLTFGLIALAEGLAAAGLYRWLAFLVVFVFLLLLVGALIVVGVQQVKRVKTPEHTIAAGKETVAYLRDRPRSS